MFSIRGTEINVGVNQMSSTMHIYKIEFVMKCLEGKVWIINVHLFIVKVSKNSNIVIAEHIVPWDIKFIGYVYEVVKLLHHACICRIPGMYHEHWRFDIFGKFFKGRINCL